MNYNDTVDIVKQIDPKIKVIFSSVTQRFDNNKLQHKVVQLNKELQPSVENITLASLITVIYQKNM